MKLKYRL